MDTRPPVNAPVPSRLQPGHAVEAGQDRPPQAVATPPCRCTSASSASDHAAVSMQGKVTHLSPYNPLDLFSTDAARATTALLALLTVPQNNMTVFVDGARIPVLRTQPAASTDKQAVKTNQQRASIDAGAGRHARGATQQAASTFEGLSDELKRALQRLYPATSGHQLLEAFVVTLSVRTLRRLRAATTQPADHAERAPLSVQQIDIWAPQI